MRRISVVGNTGSGKTTTGKAIAEALDVPFLELDSIFHQPGWTELPPEEFRMRVESFVAADRWVVDGNYTASGALDVVWEHADTAVWLDLPRLVSARRVAGRTIRRGFTGEELWNGNREGRFAFLDPRPEQNMILWSLTRHGHTRRKYAARIDDPRWAHLEVIRLRDDAAVEGLLAALRSR